MEVSKLGEDFGIVGFDFSQGSEVIGETEEVSEIKEDGFSLDSPGYESPLFTKEEEKEEDKPVLESKEEVVEDVIGEESDKDEVESKEEEETEVQEKETEGSVNYSQLAQDLFEAGVFTEEEGTEANSAEDLLEKFNKIGERIANTQINNFFTQAGEEAYKAFEAIVVNKVDPQEYFGKIAEITSFKELDLSQETNQEKVVKKYYEKLGWNEERINKRVEKLKDYDDLTEEASLAQEQLVKEEEQHLAKIEKDKKEKREMEVRAKEQFKLELQQELQEKLKQKSIGDLPLNEDTAFKVFDYMTTPAYRHKTTGEILTKFDNLLMELKRPENKEKALKIALLEENGWDFSVIKKQAISKETNKLFQRAFQKEKVEKRKSPFTDGFQL